jgi:hypothetical protein
MRFPRRIQAIIRAFGAFVRRFVFQTMFDIDMICQDKCQCQKQMSVCRPLRCACISCGHRYWLGIAFSESHPI